MYLFELAIVAVSIALFIVSMLYRKALVWLIPLAYNCVAFYLGVINSYNALLFVVIGGFALVALIGATILMFRGELI